jgi:hypothetical protein
MLSSSAKAYAELPVSMRLIVSTVKAGDGVRGEERDV